MGRIGQIAQRQCQRRAHMGANVENQKSEDLLSQLTLARHQHDIGKLRRHLLGNFLARVLCRLGKEPVHIGSR